MADNHPSPQAVLQQLRREYPVSAALHCDWEQIIRYGSFVGSVIECHRQLPRAMDRARSLIAASAESGRAIANGTVILADEMSLCKGRFTRQWHAPHGGLWGCMVFANTLLPEWRSFIPWTAGLACCEAVRQIAGVSCHVRWVNDVLVGGRKLAGFLVESYTDPVHGEEFALIGFGININNTSFPRALEDQATSLAKIIGTNTNLTEFTILFLAKLAFNFGILHYEEARNLRGDGFSGTEGRHLLLDKWLHLTDTLGKQVLFGFDVVTAPQYQAEVVAVDASGGLILRLADGSVKTEYSGEIRYLP